MNRRQAIINALNTAMPHLANLKGDNAHQARLHIAGINSSKFSDAGVADEAMWVIVYMRKLGKSKKRAKLIEDIQLALDMAADSGGAEDTKKS